MRLPAVTCAVVLAAAATPVFAATGGLRVERAWVRTPPPGAPTATAHLVVENGGRVPQKLVGAASPDFARVEVHSMDMSGGVMRMRPVSAPMEAPAGGRLDLGPDSGLHLMLIGPRRPITGARGVTLVLRFSPGGERRVELPVRAVAPQAPGR